MKTMSNVYQASRCNRSKLQNITTSILGSGIDSMKITNIIKTVKHGTHPKRRRIIKNICISSRNMEISMRS
jgi:hypothetical protein